MTSRQVSLDSSIVLGLSPVQTQAALRLTIQRLAFTLGFASISLAAQGETWPTRITIERQPGSEQCPDVDAVFGALAQLFPDSPVRPATDMSQVMIRAAVTIRHTPAGHEARLRVEAPRDGERIIVDAAPRCEGLAEALAVALVMLLEISAGPPNLTNVSAPPEPAKGESTDRTSSTTAAQAEPPNSAPAVAEPPVRLGVTLGGTGGVGLLSRPSVGVELGLSIFAQSGLGLEVSGIRLLATPAKAAPGRVELDLWAALGGACYRRGLFAPVTVEGCLLFGIGSMKGESFDYVRNGTTRRVWMVSGPKVQANFPLSRWLGGYIGLSVVGHLTRQAYSIEDIGIVADAPTAGMLLGAGLRVKVPGG